MHEGDARPEPGCIAANDNERILRAAQVDTALTRIARAIGRHIAREHIRTRNAANDNDPLEKNAWPPER
jgi:hypothetical protein